MVWYISSDNDGSMCVSNVCGDKEDIMLKGQSLWIFKMAVIYISISCGRRLKCFG